MKILFLGDYSNLHACLASELTRRHHDVTVMSDRGGYMNTHSDIFIERKPGILGGAKYLYDLFSILPRLKGYDVVQLINPNFLSLRPAKIKYFFDRLKGENGSFFLTLAGNDYYFVKECLDGKMFRYSEFKVGDRPTQYYAENRPSLDGWVADDNRRWNEYLYSRIDGAMSVLPEYDMAARPVLGDRLAFTNLPVDLSGLSYTPLEVGDTLRLFIGMKGGMEVRKGTSVLLQTAKELERDMPDKVEVACVRNLSLHDYLEKMRHSHIVLDQLYSYSPATNALQAMALGRVAGSGAQPEYYEYIGYTDRRPVLSLSPGEELKERLRAFALDPSPLMEMSRQGRELVEKHNSLPMVTDRYVAHWNKIIDGGC